MKNFLAQKQLSFEKNLLLKTKHLLLIKKTGTD